MRNQSAREHGDHRVQDAIMGDERNEQQRADDSCPGVEHDLEPDRRCGRERRRASARSAAA